MGWSLKMRYNANMEQTFLGGMVNSAIFCERSKNVVFWICIKTNTKGVK